MYIEISSEVASKLISKAISDHELAMIKDVLMHASESGRDGQHIICTSDFSCAKTVSDFFKDKKENSAASFWGNIFQRFSEIRLYRNSVICYVVVVDGNNIKAVQNNGVTIINIGIYWLCGKNNFWHCTKLVCEDDYDCDAYDLICQSLTKIIPRDKISLKYEKMLGGGVNIYRVIESQITSNYFVIAFIDSDRKYPNLSQGGTAEHVLSSTIIRNSPYADYYVLNSHEMENLFFYDFIWEGFSDDRASRLNTIACKFDHNNSKDLKNFRAYADIKSGLRYRHIKDSTLYLNYFANIIPSCTKRTNNGNVCMSCKQCGCVLFQGVGAEFIRNNIYNNATQKQQIVENLDNQIQAHNIAPAIAEDCKKIADLLFSWTVALPYNRIGLSVH